MSAEIHPRQISTVLRLVLLVILVVAAGRKATADMWTFTATGTMLTPAEAATAVALDAGEVLLFGDATGAQPELYDPSAKAFAAAGVLEQARAGAAGVRLDDGRVLVVGGWDGAAALATAAVFDPLTRTFSELDGSMSAARIHATATRLLDGRVLVLNGYNETGLQGGADLFNPRTGAFAPTGAMAVPRLGTATRLEDGRVLIAGGQTAEGRCTDTVEFFNPSLDEFVPGPGLARARCNHQAVLLPDGRVLVAGGYDNAAPLAHAEIFDPADGRFHETGEMVTARAHHGAVVLDDGEVLIVGGYGTDGALATSEVYTPVTGTFAAAAGLAFPRLWPAVAVLADGRVLVAGGRGAGGDVLGTAEIYMDARPPARVATSTELASSATASTFGQPVIYSARVTSAKGTPDGTVQFVDDTSVLATATLDVSGAARATVTGTPAGVRSIRAVYSGTARFAGSESQPVTQNVARRKATSTLMVSPSQRQYSDRVTFEASVSPADAAQSVTFTVATQAVGTAPVVAGKAVLVAPLLGTNFLGGKVVSAIFNQEQRNYDVATQVRSINILREDARVTFTAPKFVTTGCGSCSSTTVRLEATVMDISAVTPTTDTDPGDIGTATVAFINRATGTVIQTVAVKANPYDRRVGKAVYDWPVNIGKNSSQTFTIGMVVGSQYVRGSTLDDAKVTVTRR